MYWGYRKDRDALIAGQRARISRWFRDSEAGWLFYDHRGRAWHIYEAEARELEAEAVTLMERWFQDQETLAKSSNCTIAILCLFCMGMALAFPIVGLCAFAVPFYLIARCVFQAIDGYYGAQRRWRAAIAERLAGDLRGGVDRRISEKHHRHNIFRYGTYFAMTVLVAMPLGVYGFRISGIASVGLFCSVILFALLGLLTWAGDRVDATHRRRKWLD